MKKIPLLLIVFIIITTLTLFAFPGAISATGYVPDMTHTHYCIISSPFNEPITIEKNYNNYADALSAAKNMAHVAMYRADVQSKIATLTNEGFINYLYDGLFHRTPEEAGFAGWLFGLNNGWSRSNVIDYFINSPEFEMRYVYGYSMPPAALSSAKAITAFSFLAPVVVNTVTINEVAKTIQLIVTFGETDVTALVATFTNSPLSSVTVGIVPQVSGVTPNDFSILGGLLYTVTAEDLSTATYTVTVFTLE